MMITTLIQKMSGFDLFKQKGLLIPSIRIFLSFLIAACLFIPFSGSVKASSNPTFTIIATNPGYSVTIQTAGFPANQDFTVRIGEYGSLAIGASVVGATNSGPGDAFQATYLIPDSLKERKYLAMRFDNSTGSYFSYNWFINKQDGSLPPDGSIPDSTSLAASTFYGYSGVPTFQIMSVTPGVSISIQTSNFPPNQDFTVRMGDIGTLAIGGIVVATTNSGSGGSFQATYNIPDTLKNSNMIAIRADNPNGHYYSYNWFENIPGTSSIAGATPGYSGTPTFRIQSVVRGEKVSIKTLNFPANQTFTVRMGDFGSGAKGGIIVGATESGTGGSFEATYTIPEPLKTFSRIAMRLESPTGFYTSYNWFWNTSTAISSTSTTPGGSGPELPATYNAIPEMKILAVVGDGNVSIETTPFPPNRTFTVRMGYFDTTAMEGIVVGTAETGTGGSFKATYDIPASLKGLQRIAIRMDSTDGYYSFNWFWNTSTATAPILSTTPKTTTPGGSGPELQPTNTYNAIPEFKILTVVMDSKVSIETTPFPPNHTFTIKMGFFDTAGVGGTVVGTAETGTGGSFKATYDIPAALKGMQRIAIRMESTDGYYTYNWFWNNTTN